MAHWATIALESWGRDRARVTAARPERLNEVVAALAQPTPRGILAHGAGRSYGDVALNDGGHQVLTGRLDRLLSFDSGSGVLVAECGVTFDLLRRIFLPRGFACPVIPGTGAVTLGGAAANDIHGKNHDAVGSFGDHVVWIDVAVPGGGIARCSREELPELFDATIGGIGLTGLIVQMAIRMVRVPSSELMVRETRLPHIDAFLSALVEARTRSTYSVGWIDAMARGADLGRGILETAEWAPLPTPTRKPRGGVCVPFDLPGFALNSWLVKAFNQLYWQRVPPGGRERTMPAHRFFHPLDTVHRWNRLYGRRGFRQFQCVLPDASASQGLVSLLDATARARMSSFLAVLKTLGAEGRGHLSFPIPGFTLALDFPRRRGVDGLLAQLEKITRDHGGRVYLAKDATLSPAGFADMYPRLGSFRHVLAEIDPKRRMGSNMARRLAIHEVP